MPTNKNVTIIDCHTADGTFLDCCTLGDNDPGAMLRRESKRHGAVWLSVRVVEVEKTVDRETDFADWIMTI